MRQSTSILIHGDIIGSKRASRQQQYTWAERLRSALDQLNQRYDKVYLVPFSVVAGDAFGGVVANLADAVVMVLALQGLLAPVEGRVVIVSGQINNLDTDNFNELYGDALFTVNHHMNQLKKNKKYFAIEHADEVVRLAVDNMVNLIFALRQKWSAQVWAIDGYRQQSCKQATIAQKLDISQQYVSKLMLTSNMRLIESCQQNLLRMLDMASKERG